ncbi:MAG: sialidase family protein, partial [Ardenticatenales bacterium]
GLVAATVSLGLAGCGSGGNGDDAGGDASATQAVSATIAARATMAAKTVSDVTGAMPTMALVRVTPQPTATQDPSLPERAHTLIVDAKNPDLLYLTFVRGIMHSADGGLTWEPMRSSKIEDGRSVIAGTQVASGRLLVAGPGALRTSDDAGATWNAITPSLGVDIRGLVTDPADGERLFALFHTQGVATSTDDGKSWALAGAKTSALTYGLWVIGASPTVLATVDRGAGTLLRSADGGTSWSPLAAAGASGEWLSIARAGAGRLVAATTEGMFESTDGGARWTKFGPFKVLATMAVAPSDASMIFAITPGAFNVFRSLDGGASWPGSGTPSATPFPAGDATPLPTIGP